MKQQDDPGKPQSQVAPGKGEVDPAAKIIVEPRALPRCQVQPTQELWRKRDLMAEIQAMARRGFIAIHPVEGAINELSGLCKFPAGWTAYGFRVPAGEKIHIRLRHPNEGWFRLIMVNKWGGLDQGMLQNLIPTGNPEVTFTNPTRETQNVHVIVDDPGWMSSKANPFTLKITRSWDPGKHPMDGTPIVMGIWAEKSKAPNGSPASAENPEPSKG